MGDLQHKIQAFIQDIANSMGFSYPEAAELLWAQVGTQLDTNIDDESDEEMFWNNDPWSV